MTALMMDTDEMIEAGAAVGAGCADGREFMAVADADGGVYWVAVDDEGNSPELDRMLSRWELACAYNGEVNTAECGHLTCDSPHEADDVCWLPKDTAIMVSAGRMFGPWETCYPAEYESACEACAARQEPDYGDWE
jgi:hypothetical protein